MNDILKVNNLNKKYHTIKSEIDAISDISFTLKKGEIISIIGPSGCGKSTLLSIIGELDNDYDGTIDKKTNKIAYMLQSDALLPWLTVYENVVLGLIIQNKINHDNLQYVDYLFNLYNLNEFKNNYPDSLSGGMKQRIALIRTLALKPDILLLDEPFSRLDEQTKLMISNDVYNMCKCNNISVILVTHNISEAIYFSDRIIILTKRPSIIKKIIEININKNSLYERKKDKLFNYYFEMIWKELVLNE